MIFLVSVYLDYPLPKSSCSISTGVKKELDEFLPQIATYATPKELTAITLSQLAIIEKQILHLLHNIAKKDSVE
ncbi:hypothetical protein [Flavobacterium sp.]|uniref:hypothetical protein n=1 Tax=Flavobacterium sp. TaxID=239 RepID=UPI0039E23868